MKIKKQIQTKKVNKPIVFPYMPHPGWWSDSEGFQVVCSDPSKQLGSVRHACQLPAGRPSGLRFCRPCEQKTRSRFESPWHLQCCAKCRKMASSRARTKNQARQRWKVTSPGRNCTWFTYKNKQWRNPIARKIAQNKLNMANHVPFVSFCKFNSELNI